MTFTRLRAAARTPCRTPSLALGVRIAGETPALPNVRRGLIAPTRAGGSAVPRRTWELKRSAALGGRGGDVDQLGIDDAKGKIVIAQPHVERVSERRSSYNLDTSSLDDPHLHEPASERASTPNTRDRNGLRKRNAGEEHFDHSAYVSSVTNEVATRVLIAKHKYEP
jgi:hypothetical protein